MSREEDGSSGSVSRQFLDGRLRIRTDTTCIKVVQFELFEIPLEWA